MNDTQIAVIGGGVVGSAAAWRLAARGYRVTLVEQFGPGHANGASHGTSRIFRHAYSNLNYVALAAQAERGWRELQDQQGVELLTRTGAVDHGDPHDLRQLSEALSVHGISHDWIDPVDAEQRWPGLRFDTAVLHHAAAGRLHADRAVAALQAQASAEGAELRHYQRVGRIEPTVSGVRIRLGDDTLTADQVVVAAGAWTSDLLADHLPLPAVRTTQEQPVHLRPVDPAGRWPSFIHHPGGRYRGEGIYGLGSEDGVKIGEHGTGPLVHPDTRDFRAVPAGVLRLQDYAQTWLPGVDPTTAEPISCLYTTTPDHHFVIDRRNRITVAAGFSGHGFKFGPALGDLVAELVADDRPARPLFALARFTELPTATAALTEPQSRAHERTAS